MVSLATGGAVAAAAPVATALGGAPSEEGRVPVAPRAPRTRRPAPAPVTSTTPSASHSAGCTRRARGARSGARTRVAPPAGRAALVAPVEDAPRAEPVVAAAGTAAPSRAAAKSSIV